MIFLNWEVCVDYAKLFRALFSLVMLPQLPRLRVKQMICKEDLTPSIYPELSLWLNIAIKQLPVSRCRIAVCKNSDGSSNRIRCNQSVGDSYLENMVFSWLHCQTTIHLSLCECIITVNHNMPDPRVYDHEIRRLYHPPRPKPWSWGLHSAL